MNGQLCKRIRLASSITGISVKILKRSYKQNPYHKRNTPVKESHGEVLRSRYIYPKGAS